MNNINNLYSMHNLPRKQTGLSLIELMIASVIGLIILGGAVTIFSSNNASSSMSTGMSRLQDSGRVALDIVANSVRMAGYEGCRSAAKRTPAVIASVGPTINLPGTAIWGAEIGNSANPAGWTPAAPVDLANVNNAVVNTDVIYLQHASGRSTNLNVDMGAASDTSFTMATNPDQLTTNEMVMISDCERSHVFRTTSVSNVAGAVSVAFGSGSNTRANLGVTYSGTGDLENEALRIMRFESSAYYVGNSGRTTPGNDPIFSLFALDATVSPANNRAPIELIEGVENMQILYGERLNNGNIRYVDADDVTSMNNVVSVQIGILIATANYANDDNDERIYNLAGVTIGPDTQSATDFTYVSDRRLRAAFNTTIQLRNRTPI